MSESNRPLCVDLDGTLIRTDSLVESVALLLKQQPLAAWRLPLWLAEGRQALKAGVARHVSLDVEYLPYEEKVIEHVREARAAGRRTILCTGAARRFADDVAAHLGLFDEVLASDPSVNLTGASKRAALVERFGAGGYDYMGNDGKDIPVMRDAAHAWLVAPTPALAAAAPQFAASEQLTPRVRPRLKDYVDQLRLHQWAKNLLVFLPLLASHRFTEPGSIALALSAFLAYGLCASSVYVLNDLMDLPVDRRHPRKRFRPFADARIPVLHGLLLIPVLTGSAFVLAALMPPLFALLLLVYFAVSLTYNLWSKHVAVLDTLFLAGLYTLRIMAGAAAIAVVPSFWLLAFSMFFFLSVALAKRYSEIVSLGLSEDETIPGRQYRGIDLSTLMGQGTSSGYAAVLVLALYINSDDVSRNFSHPQLIWLICPLMLYWINKLWLNTQRREVHDDPLVWAMSNRVSRGIAVSVTLLFVLAI